MFGHFLSLPKIAPKLINAALFLLAPHPLFPLPFLPLICSCGAELLYHPSGACLLVLSGICYCFSLSHTPSPLLLLLLLLRAAAKATNYHFWSAVARCLPSHNGGRGRGPATWVTLPFFSFLPSFSFPGKKRPKRREGGSLGKGA